MKMSQTMRVVLLILDLDNYSDTRKFVQKEFAIQVFICIDKARYGHDKILSSQRILEKSNSVNQLPGKL